MQARLGYLTLDDLKQIQEKAERLNFASNAIIIKEGETANAIYIINEGFVEVQKNNMMIARLGKGEMFGEMSFLEQKPVSATVLSESATQIARIPAQIIDELFTQYPEMASRFYKTLAIHLSSRLRTTSKFLAQLRSGREKMYLVVNLRGLIC